ncbi:MAG TPA: hypothetical protein P5254_18975 [Aquihabitans sp.]|nr:hypothetical protein [Aquihabitans sp.]
MNDAHDPIDGDDPTAARVRDALHARADGVEPAQGDPAHLAEAIAADRARRRRRAAWAGIGAAAAAVLVVGGLVLASGGDGGDQVVTGTEPGAATSSAPTSTTEPPETTTTGAPTTSAPTTTESTTTLAPATTAPPTTVPPTTAPVLPGGSTDPRSGPTSGPYPALLTDVRTGCQAGASRVVLEFADGAMPGWTVQYVDPPIVEDGRGETVAVRGTAFLQVRMSPAWAHDLDQPDAPPTYLGPDRLDGGCASHLELVETGEFEAVTTWVIGVPERVPFTVNTLSGPSRLVIDLAT